MTTWTFASRSGAGEYTATRAEDGKLLCTCRGWTMRRPNQPRLCTHLQQVIARLGFTTEARGEFVFVIDGTSIESDTPSVQELAAPRVFEWSPMLASAMLTPVSGGAFNTAYGHGWALEEKLDGHRVITIREGRDVAAWSRPRASGTANRRALPPDLVALLRQLPPGVYDGELVVPGGTSSDVVTKGASLVLVLFDILARDGQRLIEQPWLARRKALLIALAQLPDTQERISTVESVTPRWATVERIWKRGGEGAILKRVDSLYRPGWRSPDWVKVKASHHATLTLIGFEAGKSGPYSALRVREEATGIETTVKTLGNALLADITANPASYIGRRVVITYQQRTAAQAFRHGIFDHFAGTGE